MDGPTYMLAAFKSCHSSTENSYQSIRANGRGRGSLWIMTVLCPLHSSRSFVLRFSLEHDSSSEGSVLGANEKAESSWVN